MSHFCSKCAKKIMDSAKAKFTPSFEGKIFIWGAKKCPPQKINIINITHHGDLVWPGERDCTPFIDRTEYYSLS